MIGGRYGLSSKEMTPSMIKPIFDELGRTRPKRHFTVGIYDDVTHLSLPIDREFRHPRPAGEVQAVFFGLGSDGTVGANKASVKIIGEGTDLFAQGYFVYDSKKSGSITVSHLRFGPEPIRSTYLVEDADFVACHQFGLLGKSQGARVGQATARRCCSTPRTARTRSGSTCRPTSSELVDKDIDLWVIDAFAVAAEVGMGSRINTVMQPCFFHAGRHPAGRRGDRADQGVRGEDVRQARRRGRAAQLRGDRPIARAAEPRVARGRIAVPPAMPRARHGARLRRATSPAA